MQEEQGYRVPEVQRIVGISYRQLDYWARTGLVRPSIRDAQGSGTQRLYSFQDLLVLKVIRRLLDIGVSLQKVRKAVEYLRQSKQQLHAVTLVSDGQRIYTPDSTEALVDLIAGGQGAFVIPVDNVWKDLEGSLRKRARAVRAGGA
jgi:DNA-binding transcriptional MerR regulator